MGLNNTQALTLLLMSLAICLNNAHDSTTLVLAIIIFGDSADVRNNDYILTLFKANYPPYGRDFVTYQPTGRFCNGKLVIDMTGNLFSSRFICA